MLNNNYQQEMIMARNFLEKYKNDKDLKKFLANIIHKSHNEKWSEIFDYLNLHYSEEVKQNGQIITGLTYLIEG